MFIPQDIIHGAALNTETAFSLPCQIPVHVPVLFPYGHNDSGQRYDVI